MTLIYIVLIIILSFFFSLLVGLINIIKKNENKKSIKFIPFISYIWLILIFIISILGFRDEVFSLPNKLLNFTDIIVLLLFITPFIFYSGYRINKEINRIISFCIIFPIGEEIIFRAIIPSLLLLVIGTNIMVPFPLLKEISLQVLISSILFGLMHIQYFKFKINKDVFIKIIFAFIFGVFMGNLVDITNSILYPIIFHIIANSGTTINYFSKIRGNYYVSS